MTTGETIDITPTREGQLQMLRLFGAQVLADVRKTRRDSDRQLIGSIVDLAFTLGFNAALPVEREEVVGAVTEWA